MTIILPFPPACLSGHNIPSQDDLRRLLDYNSETGKFRWKARGEPHFDAQFAGKEALTSKYNGYFVGAIFQRYVRAHRVAYKYVFGYEPKEIDHINGDRSDNRICNLRGVTRVENGRNLARSKRNRSGVTGVCYRPERRKWRAFIQGDGRQVFLGNFDTIEEAIVARKNGEQEHDYHPNHGRPA